MGKEYKLPLSKTEKESLSKIYEEIYLKKPHHKLSDENLVIAVNLHKPEHKLHEEEEEADKEQENAKDTAKKNKPEDVGENPKENEEKEIAQYIENFGAKPKKGMPIEAIKEANLTYAEAKKNVPKDVTIKKGKKVRNPNLIDVTDGNKTIAVNPQTFEMFLSKQGWKKVVNKPKEIK